MQLPKCFFPFPGGTKKATKNIILSHRDKNGSGKILKKNYMKTNINLNSKKKKKKMQSSKKKNK